MVVVPAVVARFAVGVEVALVVVVGAALRGADAVLSVVAGVPSAVVEVVVEASAVVAAVAVAGAVGSAAEAGNAVSGRRYMI